jgi:mRNA deadenylase 3'-5' endonuclease subunit Ccr4
MLQLEKTMEIMNELDKYNIDVTSLQEIRTRTNI